LLVSIVLDNYNYANYLPNAVDSVLAQTYADFELIVVDDGSTDESRGIIEAYAAKDARVKPIFKSNGGQATAFNTGFAASKGDIICFLDSDDYFAPTKLEEIVAAHGSGYEYIYTDNQSVNSSGKECADNIKRYAYDGQNLFLVYYMSKYPGNVTSTISLTRRLADKVFPLPNEQGWRIQADDVIVFQAAMMGRAKFLDKKLTYYRIHDTNGHYGKKRSADYMYELLQKRNALKDAALCKLGVSDTFLKNSYNLLSEFDTHRKVDRNLLNLYLSTLWFQMDLPILNRVKSTVELLKKYKNSLRKS